MEAKILSRGLLMREIKSYRVEGRLISEGLQLWLPVEIGDDPSINRITISAHEFATRHGRARWNKDGTATLFLNSKTSYEIRFLPRPIASAQPSAYC